MASNLYIPFNFAPSSVAVKTGSYTIPAGKYARVVVNLIGSATFTIGGVTALSGTQNSVITSDNNLYRVGGTPGTIATGNSGQLGTTSFSGAPGTSTSAVTVFANTTDQKSTVAEYWFPTGTIINGTGTWRATVMEYNEIT